MDSTETRLRRAAAETREVASHALPPSLRQERTPGSGWLVLATAFAAVLLLFAVPALIGGQDTPLGEGPQPTQSPPTTIGATTTITMIDDTPQQCSAEGTPKPELSSALPADVVATARVIIGAASDCDFDDLARIASTEGSPDLITSFGGIGGVENLARWEEEGYGEMDTLIRLFGTTATVVEREDGPEIYVWPAAFAFDHWEDIPREYLAELIDLGVYTEGELDEIAKFGSYAGWRIGIDQNGEWLFFVAGD